ncbi:NHS-like protein 3 [Diretmus argenteus]
MSRRSSTGDLVPKDISEILAREARAQRGQKKPGGSLGQAFSWLKGSRRKKNISNGMSRTGTGDVKLQNHDPVKAGPKGNEDQKRLAVHYTASRHYQENVFIESSRPQYLEDLHTEAQEGLKILQQEEHKNGVNLPDDESIASAGTLRPEQDNSSKDGGSPESRPTTGNTDTTATSAVSAVSSRPVLTRQGSTFKPLNPVKRFEKTRKRSRRTTIMGIPHQVQRELALHRSSTFQQVASTDLPSGDEVSDRQSGVVIIPTVDGETPVANQEGARVHLSDLEVSREEQLLKHHLQAMYQDEQPFSHQGLGYSLSPTSSQRPKSVAVPGMTTSSSSSSTIFGFLQEPQGPVMSISPQATYLSKIIPNAVLPASVDVIQIDRSSSRTHGSNGNHGGRVRTVSKSSLVSGDSISPVPSRRSDGDGSNADNSHTNSMIPTSALGSNWSQSQSSETIISNSSVSSKESTGSGNPQTTGLTEPESQPKQPGKDQDRVSLHSSVSLVSSPSGKDESLRGPKSESGVSAGESMRNSRAFNRSLSVMKTKLPPAPPRRTNSLHNTKIRTNSKDVKNHNDSVFGDAETAAENILSKDETKLVTAASSLDDSRSSASSNPFSPVQASSGGAGGSPEPQSESSSSSPQKTPSEGGKFERTMSPSSGYSSQSGTPTLSPKGISQTSPDKQKKKPVKPERSVSRASSSAASASSSLTSLSSTTSESVNQELSASSSSPPQHLPSVLATEKITPVNNSPSSASLAIRGLYNIPPPPKVKAPGPPPPETWAHNRHTFELLCGPCPNVGKLNQLQKPGQLKDSTVKETVTPTEASNESQGLAEKQTTVDKHVLQLTEIKESVKPETLLVTDTESDRQELESRECPSAEQERLSVPEMVEASVEIQRQEQSHSPQVKNTESQETKPKKEPPPVMKKTMAVSHKEELVSAEKSVEGQREEVCGSVTIEVNLPVETHMSSSQTEAKGLDKSEVEMDRGEVTSMQTLSIDAPKVTKVSPPPTPPPAYHPTPPPSRKTPPSSVSTPPEELKRVQEESHVVESCWPPPPPPLEGDSVFDGGDEMDFPPPPPPFVTDSLPDVMDRCITEMDVPGRPVVALQDVCVTIKDSAECGNAMNGKNADLPPIMPQTMVTETNPEEVMQVSKANISDKAISCNPVQNVSSLPEGVPPPPVEAPPPPPVASAETLLTVSPSVPPSSVATPLTVKIEDQSPPEPTVSAPLPPPPPISGPVAPPLPPENQAPGVNFRRQPSLANRDTRSKELLSRHKSASIPKEDANIPLVTPSLLQMVRLRSVNMAEDQVKAPSEDKSANEGAPGQESCPVSIPGSQNIPQKPIRKSLSLKSSPQTVKTSSGTLNAPSMRLQEAIRMKTAAMSSKDSLPSRLGLRSSTSSNEPGAPSTKSSEGGDMHKSPASTASFIFSRSTKKVVIETAVVSSPEAQATLKHSLVAELMQVSDQSKATAFSNGGVKSDKVPPPVAKKPAHGSTNPSQKLPACSSKTEQNQSKKKWSYSVSVLLFTVDRFSSQYLNTLGAKQRRLHEHGI